MQDAGFSMQDAGNRLLRTHLLETVWKVSAGVMVAYALRYGEQEIPHGSVRRRMALHQPASSRAHRARTSQASRLTVYSQRRFLRAQERLPVAAFAPRVPALVVRFEEGKAVEHWG
jgi:hypothetical protein